MNAASGAERDVLAASPKHDKLVPTMRSQIAERTERALVAVVRRRGQQDDVRRPRGQGRCRIVTFTAAIAAGDDTVRLVDHEHVPSVLADGRQHFGPLHIVDRTDRDWHRGPRVQPHWQRLRPSSSLADVHDDGREAEAFVQLASPLVAQTSRRQDEHPFGGAALPQFR